MIKKENLDKTSAWPFVEAKKMLRERKSFIEKKGKITLIFIFKKLKVTSSLNYGHGRHLKKFRAFYSIYIFLKATPNCLCSAAAHPYYVVSSTLF